jgi:hypothetical protein
MATPTGEIVGVKNWSDERQCWVVAICQVTREADGSEKVYLLDIECADTQVEIDDWIRQSIATRPWESTNT